MKPLILFLLIATYPILAKSPQVKALALGSNSVCALFADGSVKCWGDGFKGSLGVGDLHNRGDDPNEMGENLKAVDLGKDVIAIQLAGGGSHFCALLSNKTVKCWGSNDNGELGLGDRISRGMRPQQMGDRLPQVDLGEGVFVSQVVAGNYHSCALLEDRTVKCWGQNGYGQLGLGDTLTRGVGPGEMGENLLRVDLGKNARVIQLGAGYQHTCALLEDRSVKCWGRNVYGQLGLGDKKNRGSEANQMGENLPKLELGRNPDVVQIALGGIHSCALFSDGRAKCWGNNNFGQLGIGSAFSYGARPNSMGDYLPYAKLGDAVRVEQLVAGGLVTCARFANHSLIMLGRQY